MGMKKKKKPDDYDRGLEDGFAGKQPNSGFAFCHKYYMAGYDEGSFKRQRMLYGELED